MHIILLNWIFIFIILMGLGWWARNGLQKIFQIPFNDVHPLLHQLMGLVLLISTCNFASFFIRINVEVVIVVFLIAVLGVALNYLEFRSELEKWCVAIKKTHSTSKVAFLFFIVIALLLTVSPSEIEDEGGYHLPLIRWIENFSIVPGIANIEDRMGFNPSKYIADAFFSFSYLFKGGLYELNSYLFLLFNCYFLGSYDRLIKGKFDSYLSDMIATASMLFLWRMYLTSVDADYLNIFLGLTLIILLVKKVETYKIESFDKTSIQILLFFLFIITVKFSSVLLVVPLTLAVPSFFNSLNKNRKIIGACSLIIFVFLPWVGRNYVISGYPIYPIYFLTLDEPDWQVLPAIAKGQFEYIGEFAKMEVVQSVNNYQVGSTAIIEWMPKWLQINWAMLAGKITILCVPLGALSLLILSYVLLKNKSKDVQLLLLGWLLFFSVLIWFYRFPAIRIYWSGIFAFCVLVSALLIKKLSLLFFNHFRSGLFLILFLGLFRGVVFSFESLPDLTFLIHPASIKEFSGYEEIYIDGVAVKVSEDNYCWGEIPPCFPKDYLRSIKLRGGVLNEGFKAE